MSESVLAQAFVYLCAAVVFVPIAKRLGLGAVLGYLVGGVVIGPWLFGFVGTEGHSVMHFAEFGVVMMLFLVGLELRPALLWKLRRPIVGLGGLQVGVTAAAVAGAALGFGVGVKPAVAVGLTFAMSSTAIVLSSGIKTVVRETFGSAYEAGIEALRALGYRAHTAHRLARKWRDHEEAVLEELGALWGSGDRNAYLSRTRNAMDEAERLMRDEDPTVFADRDAGWDNESLRADTKIEAAAVSTIEPT